MYVCMHACMFVCLFACLFVRVYACMYVCVFVPGLWCIVSVCMCVHVYIYVYTYIYTCVSTPEGTLRREHLPNPRHICSVPSSGYDPELRIYGGEVPRNFRVNGNKPEL